MTVQLKRLLSRKFLIAALTVSLLIVKGQYNEAVVVATGYLGVQGLIDRKDL